MEIAAPKNSWGNMIHHSFGHGLTCMKYWFPTSKGFRMGLYSDMIVMCIVQSGMVTDLEVLLHHLLRNVYEIRTCWRIYIYIYTYVEANPEVMHSRMAKINWKLYFGPFDSKSKPSPSFMILHTKNRPSNSWIISSPDVIWKQPPRYTDTIFAFFVLCRHSMSIQQTCRCVASTR